MFNMAMVVIFVLSVLVSIAYIVYSLIKDRGFDSPLFNKNLISSPIILACVSFLIIFCVFTCTPSSGVHCVKKIAKGIDNEVDVLLAIDGRGSGGWLTLDTDELGSIKEKDCVEYVRSFWLGMRSIKYIPGDCCTDMYKNYGCGCD